jgi:hypothetical protein
VIGGIRLLIRANIRASIARFLCMFLAHMMFINHVKREFLMLRYPAQSSGTSHRSSYSAKKKIYISFRPQHDTSKFFSVLSTAVRMIMAVPITLLLGPARSPSQLPKIRVPFSAVVWKHRRRSAYEIAAQLLHLNIKQLSSGSEPKGLTSSSRGDLACLGNDCLQKTCENRYST